jgi:pimeloyl-ACP methyl ester carboxylesterase
VSYYPHNLHFLWAAATLEGRSTVAIDAARQVAAKVPHHHAGALAWTTDFPVTPWLAYVRFGQWQQMLTEPRPPVTEPYAMGIWHYARGLAFVARDQHTRAASELEALTEVMKHEAFQTTFKDLPLLTNLQIASRIVRGEIEGRAGRKDDAVRSLQEAVVMEDALPYSEPPIWHQPVRQVLGAILMEAGRPSEAAAVYQEDLQRVRENGWSLFGLWQSLAAQGKTADAERARARFEKTWARATITLTSSRVMSAAHSAGSDPAGSSAQVQEGPMEKSVALPSGLTLHYAEQGQASGVPVLFLHGVTDSWRSFEPVLRQLPASIHAFALSQRGHGNSSRPEAGYRYTDLSEDARAFMDAAGLPAAVVVGHSMGAMVAQRLAVDHPDRVAGLVLLGAFSTLHGHQGVQDFWNTTISTLRDPIDPDMVREFQTSTLANETPQEFLDTVVSESLKVPARVWQATFTGFIETADFSHELATITSPTLIVWGDRDGYALLKDQQALAAAIPHARRVTYEGGGHAFHWESAERFAGDLVTFVYEPHHAGHNSARSHHLSTQAP